jgi:hypothetical protein
MLLPSKARPLLLQEVEKEALYHCPYSKIGKIL